MDFVKTEHLKRPNLPLEFPLSDRDRDMVDELNSRDVGQLIVHNVDYAIPGFGKVLVELKRPQLCVRLERVALKRENARPAKGCCMPMQFRISLFDPKENSMARPAFPSSELRQVLLETYAVNDRMNQLILEHLDPEAWRAKPPGRNVRTIAAIFTHMHNIRRKWLRLSAPHLKLPAQLDRTRCTQPQARAALEESALLCGKMLAEALGGPGGRVEQFRRDAWAKPWPGGLAMFAYMISHDNHHRGQVCMLAHQMGFPLPGKANYGIWTWEKLWRECGFKSPR